jgi:hypothetical protein
MYYQLICILYALLCEQKFYSCKKWVLHIRSASQVPETFSGHVRPQTGHVQPNPISQQLSPGPDISGPQAGFQRS